MANQTFREEMVDIAHYWCFRAKYSVKRTWYFRLIAAICRRCGQ